MGLQTVLIVSHASAALAVLLLGPVNMLRRRRDRFHRLLGRSWVALMYATCVSGLFIYDHGVSFFHVLAVFTLCTVSLGVWRIRRGDRRGHAGSMIGSYAGTLIAFAFAALLPDRFIQQTATTHPAGLLAYTGGLVLALLVWLILLRRIAHGGTASHQDGAASHRTAGAPAPAARPERLSPPGSRASDAAGR